jgi:nucleoside-diphosphate-sugar epimerase
VVQISAFGVRSDSPFPYFTSKFQADEFLQDELSDRCLILRPSLVYGARGEATQLFRRLATLPVVPLPAGGKFRFRPVLVEDLARLVVEGVLAERMPTGVYDVGGAEVMTLEQILLAVRAWSQHVEDKQSPKWTDGPTMSVPLMLMRPAAWSGDLTKMGPLDSDMLGMLVRSEAPEIGPLLADFTTRPRGLFTYLQEHPDDSEERSLQEGSW